MAQDYDKIFKQNFERIIETISKKILGITGKTLEEIPDTCQYTIEKQPDFVKKIIGIPPEASYILHIEIQSTDPKTMVRRMLIYYGFLYHDYGIEIEQIVIYIGRKGEPNMPDYLDHKNLNYNFKVINIQDIDYEVFFNSSKPEDIILAILCDFKGEEPIKIITKILKRLKKLVKCELDMGKYLTQLQVLSKLRNLEEATVQKIKDMNMRYFWDMADMDNDHRYKHGIRSAKKGVILNLKGKFPKMTLQEISSLVELPISKVIEIIENPEKEEEEEF